AWAQAYPTKPVRVVVPYVAGGSIDIVSRLFAQGMSEDLRQPFVVENRPGANGNVGTEQVARSTADGYTLAMVSAGTIAINPFLYKSMSFDTQKDLAPVSLVASGPMVLVVNSSLPIRTLNDLIAYAKANPGKLNMGSGGNGSLAHLSAEMMRSRTGIGFTHVPYKGTSLAQNDLIAGHIQAMFDTLYTAVPFITEGRTRALAVTSTKRSSVLPDVPTIAEIGVRDYSADAWAGLVGPAGLPREIAARLQASIARFAQRDAVQKKLVSVGSEGVASTPEQFAAAIQADRAKWAEVVKASGARID
ncbi:MAG: tripartite tricarboxylate transporter substrate binding protein, partial [Betaproteobacteria bacterium]|nr:tripartite tricarboxylate transporter substrate binding protein [Betaproteobacteria bacterium]